MTVMKWLGFVVLFASLAPACTSRPVDPEGTLERVTGGTLRVGVSHNEPWATAEDPPEGIEVELVERFASSIDAQIEWFPGTEEGLFAALRHGELDLVIGGFGAKNPFTSEVAFTHPYFTSRVVVAVPAPSPVPEDIAGVEVAVEEGMEAAGILAKTDARRVIVEDVTEVEGARAIDDWLLDDLELAETGVNLTETDHVMALRMGENGFMVELEMFLLSRPEEIQAVVDELGAP